MLVIALVALAGWAAATTPTAPGEYTLAASYDESTCRWELHLPLFGPFRTTSPFHLVGEQTLAWDPASDTPAQIVAGEISMLPTTITAAVPNILDFLPDLFSLKWVGLTYAIDTDPFFLDEDGRFETLASLRTVDGVLQVDGILSEVPIPGLELPIEVPLGTDVDLGLRVFPMSGRLTFNSDGEPELVYDPFYLDLDPDSLLEDWGIDMSDPDSLEEAGIPPELAVLAPLFEDFFLLLDSPGLFMDYVETADPDVPPAPPGSDGTVAVVFDIMVGFDEFDETQFVEAFAFLLEIPVESIRIVSKLHGARGRTLLVVEVSDVPTMTAEEAAAAIESDATSEAPSLAALGVVSVQVHEHLYEFDDDSDGAAPDDDDDGGAAPDDDDDDDGPAPDDDDDDNDEDDEDDDDEEDDDDDDTIEDDDDDDSDSDSSLPGSDVDPIGDPNSGSSGGGSSGKSDSSGAVVAGTVGGLAVVLAGAVGYVVASRKVAVARQARTFAELQETGEGDDDEAGADVHVADAKGRLRRQ